MTNLSQLRLDLAAARITLRQAKDELETAKAIAETNMINNGAAGGKNAEERARALIVALEGSTLYRDALSYLRESEAVIDQIQATIAIEEDTIRIEELRVREKLADALIGRRESTAVDAAVETLFHFAEEMGCDAGNFDGGSVANCEHCRLIALANSLGRQALRRKNPTADVDWYEVQNEADRRRIAAMESDPARQHDPSSKYYAGKPRPKPTFHNYATGEEEIPF